MYHSHTPGAANLYDNGCTICDDQRELLALADGSADASVPWWTTAEAQILTTVRRLLRELGHPSTAEHARAMHEVAAGSFGLFADY